MIVYRTKIKRKNASTHKCVQINRLPLKICFANSSCPLLLQKYKKRGFYASAKPLFIILHQSVYLDYSMISLTTPEPTVRPPSRIAKRRPASIATGWISSHVISMWSPGMHISVPSGSPQIPVTSVVLK